MQKSSDSDTERMLNTVDLFLIVAFLLELLLNAYANWFRLFAGNLWNWWVPPCSVWNQ